MKPHHLSASKVSLATHCRYWARGDVEHPPRDTSHAAQLGKDVHELADTHSKGFDLPKTEGDVDALWATLKDWMDKSWFVESKFSELPLLYDVENDTASYCKTGKGERDYIGITATTLPMRLDLVRRVESRVDVVDIKTGARSNVDPAATNLQLRTQALAASRFFGINTIRVGLVFPLKTKTNEDWHTLNSDDLFAHAGLISKILRDIPESRPVKGEHCWRCPIGPTKSHVSTCPLWT